MGTELKPRTIDEAPIVYVPFGEQGEIKLTPGIVRQHLAKPTKQGKLPSDSDIIQFMMLCKSRELNPWAGDAFLIGYDSSDGPTFSLITAHQALLKRAEACPTCDGMESGVIVTRLDKESEPIFREGDFVMPNEILCGGWAAVYRKDRSHRYYDALKLSTFDTGRSRWKIDPAGMIVKCAEASCLRKAFPTQLGGLYIGQEMEHLADGAATKTAKPLPNTLDALAERLETRPAEAAVELDLQAVAKAEQQADQLFGGEPDDPSIDYDGRITDCGSQMGLDAIAAEATQDDRLDRGQKAAIKKACQMRAKQLKTDTA